MGWKDPELESVFARRLENAGAVAYLRLHSPQAHSDLGDLMVRLGRLMPEYRIYCPNGLACSYGFLHTASDVIYCIAVGQRSLLVRLPEPARQEALAGGARLMPELGGEWLSLDPFDPAVPRAAMRERLERFCRAAYDYASEA